MKKLFFTLIFIAGFIFAQYAQEIPQDAPLNPSFVNYLNKIKSSKEEYLKGYIPPPLKKDFTGYNSPKSVQFDASYDLRTAGSGGTSLLTPVKNQGSCGACWTFATMGSIESRWKIQGLGDFNLSEDNLNNCHGFLFPSCEGGNLDMAASYMSRKSGPMLETQDVYSVTPNACPTGLTEQAYIPEIVYVPNDAASIKQAILDYGALYTVMHYDDAYYNSGNYTYYYSGTNDVDHAVLLVGWDDNKATAGGTGAWIIRNSWGAWGQSGFFYISYNDSKVNEEVGYFPTRIAYNSNINIYAYDDLGATSATGYGSNTAYGLIKYVASANQQITQIGTWLSQSNSTVSIEIYDDFDGSNLSNLLSSISNQSKGLPGYYSFDLTNPVNTASGNDFYIKIQYNTPSYNYPVPTEKNISGYASVSLETGKCWISSNGSSWLAVGSGTSYLYDVAIKAYTIAFSDQTSTFTGTGNWGDAARWNNGIPSSAVNATIDGTCTIAANASCKNLTINNTRSATLNSSKILNVSGNFLINSASSGTGQFKNSGGTLTISGTKTIQRYLSGNQWHMVSSPVISATAAVFNGFYLKLYNPATSLYDYISSASQVLTPGSGYFAKKTSDATVSFIGTPNTGTITPTIATGWNLVGNPFACALDWSATTRTNIAGSTMYLWNGSTFLTHNGVAGTADSKYVSSGQGFFVNATGAGLSFPASAQTISSQSFYKESKSGLADIVYVKAIMGENEYETIIYFDASATNDFDTESDALLLSSGNEEIPELFTTATDNAKLCINTLSALPNNVTVPLSIDCAAGEVTISASHLENFNENTGITLADQVTQQTTNLKTSTYSFMHDGTTKDRFLLHFGPAASVENLNTEAMNVYAFNHSVFVQNPTNETGIINVFDITGKMLASKQIITGLNKFDFNLPSASYIIKVKTATQNINKKVVIVK